MHSTSAVFLLFSFSHFCVQGVFGWVGEASVKMGEAFELLRFAALSSAVHADAVECLVDDTRSVLSRIAMDTERLEALEEQLAGLLEEQRRIHAVRDVLSRSRSTRSTTEPTKSGKKPTEIRSKLDTRSPGASPPGASRLGTENVLRFASRAVPEEEVPTMSRAPRREHVATMEMLIDDLREEKATEGEKCIDETVERVKSEIRSLESMSVKTKLRELEAFKRRIKDLDANAVIERYVEPFRFGDEVERLWDAPDAILNNTNMDLFISRACQRFSGRYEDALGAISDFSAYEDGDAAQVFGSLMYLEALTSSSNYDAAAVRTLQGLSKDSLLEYYREKRRAATVSTTVRRSRVETVLGPEEFGFLPEDWWSSRALFIPAGIQLPSARHILTARFSFADAHELNTLQSVRVDFQRSVLDAFIRMPKALAELREQIEFQSRHDEERDVSASLLRLLVENEKGGGGGDIWTTIARCS
ncbi:hypothetical protein TcCL_Unassigned01224 [Trypanosoma cruzi]|uniref:Uncharacterized protein n=2 Tax=Trypanosoma cruzi TaxID=5693 RepID=Q4CPB2_TRYCC|nr:hypothetical protein, conserved [Trypanosoma cruzi]EAN82114.1 hypothetical protein, conserved [Trypanosoma cruzi]RNC35870.1 hypothetical protein TcCL_Unassigned01224 [Trypanosoma cruzi]|eukprot:XP_803965.1 hypothetical protein [Trypanosoma cruzi strain CL Brener]